MYACAFETGLLGVGAWRCALPTVRASWAGRISKGSSGPGDPKRRKKTEMNVTEVRDVPKSNRPLLEGSTVRLAPGALVRCTDGLRGVCTELVLDPTALRITHRVVGLRSTIASSIRIGSWKMHRM
jgi:hypothetical protein